MGKKHRLSKSPRENASTIQRRRSQQAWAFSSAVAKNGSFGSAQGNLLRRTSSITSASVKFPDTFLDEIGETTLVARTSLNSCSEDEAVDDFLVRRTASFLGSYNPNQTSRLSLIFPNSPTINDDDIFTDMSTCSESSNSLDKGQINELQPPELHNHKSLGAYAQNITMSNMITNGIDEGHVDETCSKNQPIGKSLAFKEFLLLSVKPETIVNSMENLCKSNTYQTPDGESPLRVCGPQYLSAFQLTPSNYENTNSGVVADILGKYSLSQSKIDDLDTTRQSALAQFCYPQEVIKLRIIPRCTLGSARRLGWLGRKSDKFKLLSFTNEAGKTMRGVAITTTDEICPPISLLSDDATYQQNKVNSKVIIQLLTGFRKLNCAAVVVQVWWKKREWINRDEVKSHGSGINKNSSCGKKEERGLDDSGRSCLSGGERPKILRWLHGLRENMNESSELYLPPSWSKRNYVPCGTNLSSLDREGHNMVKRAHTMNMVSHSTATDNFDISQSSERILKERRPSLESAQSDSNWLSKIVSSRRLKRSDSSVTSSTSSKSSCSGGGVKASTSNTDAHCHLAQLLQAQQPLDLMTGDCENSQVCSSNSLPNNQGCIENSPLGPESTRICSTSVQSEWARLRAREAYENMQEVGSDEVCLIEKCFVMVGTRPGEEALAFTALQNLINCGRSRDGPSESRNTAESDDDLLPVIQSKAVLPLHLQNLSYPPNPYDHVYKRREQLELDFELKDYQSIKIPLPLPQIAGEWGLARLLFGIGSISLMKIIKLLLMERSILVLGNSQEEVTACTSTLLEILKPFEWVCTFIPSLPRSLMDFLNSPVPFIVGLVVSDDNDWSSILNDDRVQTAIHDGMSIVDLSKDVFVETQELEILPLLSIPSQLRLQLQFLLERLKTNSTIAPTMGKENFFSMQDFVRRGFESRDTLTLKSTRKAIHRYIKGLAGSIGHGNTPWQSYVQPNEFTQEIEFRPYLLVQEQKIEIRFREFLVYTQLFSAFVESRINLGGSAENDYNGEAAQRIANWCHNVWKRKKRCCNLS